MPDGSVRTFVAHPPRIPLKTPGQIKRGYEAGELDLENFIANAKEGLNAEKVVVTTHTRGSGKDRETWQEIQMVPDWDMRLKWQQHVTETVEGMPVKRQEIISKKLTTAEDLEAQCKKSPAFLRALKATIERIEKEGELSKKGGPEKQAGKADKQATG